MLSSLNGWQLFILLLCSVTSGCIVLVALISGITYYRSIRAKHPIINVNRSRPYQPGKSAMFDYDSKKEFTIPIDPTNPHNLEPNDH